MYLLIPFLLILLSAAGIAFIVHRKMPYLRKLTPESHEVNGNFFEEFFPEVVSNIDKAKYKEYQKKLLLEMEKMARRLRVVTLKVDHLSERVIKKLRHHHISAHLEHKALMEEKAEEITPVKTLSEMKAEGPKEPTMEDLLAREQQLIIEIAKSPKEQHLYIELGDLYLAMHNVEEAKESFEAALALNPHDMVLARKYSQLLKKTSEIVT